MKTILNAYPLLFTALILLGSCATKTTPIAITETNLKATLTAAYEVPPSGSSATGSASFTYNPETHVMQGTVSFSGFNMTDQPVAAYINAGAAGVNGAVLFTVKNTTPFTSPFTYASPVWNASQAVMLLAGGTYLNIVSTGNSAGAIRGQITVDGANGGTGY